MFNRISGSIERLSFRSKMGLATIAACAATVAVACVAFTVREIATYRIGFDQEQKSLTEVLAANITAAVLFKDDISAIEILSATRLTPQVDAAYVQTPDGKLFSFYTSKNQLTMSDEIALKLIDSHVGPSYKSLIIIDQEVIGELVLLTNLDELQRTISEYAIIASIVFLGSIIVAIILARWEAAAMYSPMLELRQTIQSIRETRDYSARVQTSPDKDFGRLIDNFNAMLDEIESRDERLEKLVDDLMAARDSAQSSNTAKSQFLANMSHELRTPLNAIINYSEMVAEDLEKFEEAEESIDDINKIQTAGLHLLNLINGILDLSKIEAGKMEVDAHKFDVQTVLREASDTIRPTAEKNNNTLLIFVDQEVSEAITDSMKLRQCVINLLSNACKFTSNGKIELNAEVIKEAGEDYLKVAISDTGIGMDQSQVSRLFEAFVQADASTTREYGGTGLGLAITRRLAELMGGRIEVESEEGVGSVFTVFVPRTHPEYVIEFAQEDHNTQIALTSRKEVPLHKKSRTALVVDDDPAARDLMDRIAKRMGYKTIMAEDGATALTLARDLKPLVIILDLHMPVMNGWTLLERLRSDEELCDIPTIVVSVDDDSKECYRLGAEDYFTKPVNRIELERALLSYTKLAGGKILIVEDNQDASDLLRRAAENVGFDVLVTETAENGLAILEEHDVVGIILDLGLPIMDGFEFMDRLRSFDKWKNMPVIVFSAQVLTETNMTAIQENAQGYHMKGAVSPRSVVFDLMSRSTEKAILNIKHQEVG